jgi:hypothetical protein
MSKEYIKELIEMSDDCLNLELENVSVNEFRHALKMALKEQDLDTRHACADAVMNCPEDVSGQCIWKNDAHKACMNVKAV